MNQGFDPMRRQFVCAVLDQRVNSLCSKPFSLVFPPDDIADFKTPVPHFPVVVIDHSNALIIGVIGNRPGQMIMGTARLSEPA
jgi:hypothetical protein